jgi:hypothetical protein
MVSSMIPQPAQGKGTAASVFPIDAAVLSLSNLVLARDRCPAELCRHIHVPKNSPVHDAASAECVGTRGARQNYLSQLVDRASVGTLTGDPGNF